MVSRLVALYSARDGVGKTSLGLLMAYSVAKKKGGAAFIEMNFASPSLEYLFENVVHNFWVNDFLEGDVRFRDTLVNVAPLLKTKHPLLVGFANPVEGAKRRIWERYVRFDDRLLKLVGDIKEELKLIGVNTVFIETSAGHSYSAINLIPAADELMILCEPDRLMERQTAELIEDVVLQLSSNSFSIIMNKMRRGESYEPKFIPRELISGFIPFNPQLSKDTWKNDMNGLASSLLGDIVNAVEKAKI